MLIIGHRGSKGTKPENTIASFREALKADVDIIEFDVRITRDNIPVIAHDFRLPGTRRRQLELIRRYTLSELRKRTAGSDHPIATLDEVMRECFGKVLLNIEVKEVLAVKPTLLVVKTYIKKKADIDGVLFSSFKPLALLAIRRRLPNASLALLHHRNPLGFVGWHRLLKLEAVGFHRLYVNDIALEVAKRFKLFTYAYTVNRPGAAKKLGEKGIDGIVTDYPAKMLRAFKN